MTKSITVCGSERGREGGRKTPIGLERFVSSSNPLFLPSFSLSGSLAFCLKIFARVLVIGTGMVSLTVRSCECVPSLSLSHSMYGESFAIITHFRVCRKKKKREKRPEPWNCVLITRTHCPTAPISSGFLHGTKREK